MLLAAVQFTINFVLILVVLVEFKAEVRGILDFTSNAYDLSSHRWNLDLNVHLHFGQLLPLPSRILSRPL